MGVQSSPEFELRHAATDRPVIVASVPNALTPGPVAKGNATQSVTMTASGMRIELEDQA